MAYLEWQEICSSNPVMTHHIKPDIQLQYHYSGQVVNAAMKVHSILGPGLLESVYEVCMIQELANKGLDTKSQLWLPVEYEGKKIDVGYRIDLLVANTIIVEIKAVEKVHPIYEAQILSYLKLSGLRIGLLINFNTVSLKNGIQRFINGF